MERHGLNRVHGVWDGSTIHMMAIMGKQEHLQWRCKTCAWILAVMWWLLEKQSVYLGLSLLSEVQTSMP
uniref:Uncharacterized protein n=1 Tax=Arundo donax TaxID=35708 RepID=A0A0A9A3A7_ARUDO